MRNVRVLALALVVFAGLILASCGGGGGGSIPTPSIPPAPLVMTSTFGTAFNGEDFSFTLTATGGSAPYIWSISAGALPPGLALNGSVITGQPTQDGAFNFTVQVKDSAARVASKDISGTITTRLHFVTKSLPDGVVRQPYSATVVVAGGTGSVSLAAIDRPGDLQFTNGVFSGVSQYGGNWNIIIQATDSATPANVITKTFPVDFFGMSNRYLHDGQQGDSWQESLIVNGGKDPVQWSLLSGNLPPGMNFQNALPISGIRTNTISGTPTEIGTFPFTVRVVDSSTPPRSYDAALSLRVNPAPLVITSSQLKRAEVGVAYSTALQAMGGVPPYSWSTVYAGLLPAGLTLSSSGQISGTPTSEERKDVSFQVRDSLNATYQKTMAMLVTVPLPPRNDSIANATPFPLGSSIASISPFGDPEGTANPDVDYYKIVSTGGKTVHVNVGASWINSHPSGMEPGVEIIDANGFRHATCNDPANDNQPAGSTIPSDPTPNGFDDQCMNLAYLNSNTGGAYIDFQVPGTGSVTFYVRVFDYRGDARPDFMYDLSVRESF